MDHDYDSVEWDEHKSAENGLFRGFGFDLAAQLFLVDYVEWESRGRDFGEQRFISIGPVEGRMLAVLDSSRVEPPHHFGEVRIEKGAANILWLPSEKSSMNSSG